LALRQVAAAAGGTHLAYAAVRLPALWLDGLISLALPVGMAPPSLFERYRSPSIAFAIIALATILTLAALAAWRFRRGRPLAAWALATYLLALAPVALLTFAEGWTGWGRYLYPTLPGLALWAAAALVDGALPRLREGVRQFAAGAVAVALLGCAAQTLAAGRDWRDDRSLARAMMIDHPQSGLGYSELAVVEMNQGRAAEGLTLLEKAIALNPSRAVSWSRAATALMDLGRRDEAFRAAARALALDPEDNNARYVTAIRLLQEGRGEEGARLLVEVLRVEPSQEGPWNTLAQAVERFQLGALLAALAEEPRYRSIAPRLRALATSRR
jgi:tetratricopeptide (TPR) repeat protein